MPHEILIEFSDVLNVLYFFQQLFLPYRPTFMPPTWPRPTPWNPWPRPTPWNPWPRPSPTFPRTRWG